MPYGDEASGLHNQGSSRKRLMEIPQSGTVKIVKHVEKKHVEPSNPPKELVYTSENSVV